MTSLQHDDDREPPGLYAVEPPDDWRPDDGRDRGPDRTPPNDQDAERAVLGGMLLSATARDDVVDENLASADFYRPAHELVFDAVLQLRARDEPVDAVTVSEELRRTGDLGRVGGAPYLHTLISTVPTAANAGYYARIVREQAVLRRLVEAGTKIAQLGYAQHGGGVDELVSAAQTHVADVLRSRADTGASSWQPVDLEHLLDGDPDPAPAASVLAMRDGKQLLYRGAVHSVSGEPGCGKTWLADTAVAQELVEARNVAYIDFEDRAATITGRLLALGVPAVQIVAHLRYIRPQQAVNAATLPHLLAACTGTTLAVIDGVTEAMTMHGLSLMDNEDIARFIGMLPRRIADLVDPDQPDEPGPAVLQIDHVVKNAENRGRFAIGGQHKLAAIDGCAYTMLGIKPFGRGVKGSARVVINKDRHGDVGPNGATVAELHLDSASEDGRSFAWLDAPGSDLGPDGTFRPTHLMEAVSRFVEANPGATGRQITEVVRGKQQAVRQGIQQLILGGYLRTEQGAKGAIQHYQQQPFREDED